MYKNVMFSDKHSTRSFYESLISKFTRFFLGLALLSSLVFVNPGSVHADPGDQVGYWAFDEGSGDNAQDSTIYGNDGSVSGASWTTGKLNAALSFDGLNDTVQIPNSASLSLSTNRVTLAGWIYPTDLSASWATIVQRSNTSASWFDWQLYSRAYDAPTSNHPVFRVDWDQNAAIDSGEEVQGDIVLQANTWYFIAVTYDGSAMRFYIDGTLRNTTTHAGGVIPNSSRPIWIGGNDAWGEYFSGKIDEFHIYNQALSLAEIQTLMAAGTVQRTLTVNIVGNGSVTKNPDKSNYNDGEVVQLTAVPAAGWAFSGWSGDLTGATNPQNLTMDADKTVTATFIQSPLVCESFNAYTPGSTIGTYAGWYDGGAGPVVTGGNGVASSTGLAAAANVFNWTAHPFNWNAADFLGANFQMDYQTSGSGTFDDDRLGWTIASNSTNSTNQFGVQLDHTDGGIVTYWRNSSDVRVQTSIVALPTLPANTWYRLTAQITKLTATSAKIDVSLVQLDASGNPTGTPYTGSVADTSTWSGGAPATKYFTPTSMWPTYKNFNALAGYADNTCYQVVTGAPPVQRTLTINIVGSGSVTKNPDKTTYNDGEVVQLTAVPGRRLGIQRLER